LFGTKVIAGQIIIVIDERRHDAMMSELKESVNEQIQLPEQ
jgi:hypothetical protein